VATTTPMTDSVKETIQQLRDQATRTRKYDAEKAAQLLLAVDYLCDWMIALENGEPDTPEELLAGLVIPAREAGRGTPRHNALWRAAFLLGSKFDINPVMLQFEETEAE